MDAPQSTDRRADHMQLHNRAGGPAVPMVMEDLDLTLPRSRATLDRVLSLLPAAVYVCDCEGRLVYYNARAIDHWGREPMLDDPDQKYCGALQLYRTDGTLLPHAETPMAAALQSGTGCRDEEVIIVRPDGRRVHVAVNVDPIFDDGDLVGAINCFTDITARVHAQQQLRDNEHRLTQILNALPAAVYTTDPEGLLTHYNSAAVEFSGQTPTLGEDRWCVSWKLYHTDGTPLPRDQCPMALALKAGQAASGAEAVAELPDGRLRWFAAYPTPLTDADGRVVGGVNMLLDITARKSAERRQRASDDRLQHIITTAMDAIICVDSDQHITLFNQAAEQMFGYSAQEMLGQPLDRLIPERFHAAHHRHIDDFVQSGVTIRRMGGFTRAFGVRRNGDEFPLEGAISQAESGGTRILTVILRDITARLRAEERLRESEETFRAMFERSPLGKFHTDPAGRFLRVNHAFCHMTGRSPEMLLSMRIGDLTHPQERPTEWENFQRLAEGGGDSYESRLRYLHADGRYVWVRISANVIPDALGRPWRIAAVVQDITESQRLEELLHVQHRRKDEFLATLAHELRNPLAPIGAGIEILRRTGSTNGVGLELLNSMQRQLDHLVHLVDDLLDVSRVNRGKITLRRAPLDLRQSVHSAIETCQQTLDAKGHHLELDLPHDPLVIQGDPTRLVQIVANLLNNAAKYTEPGGRIRISLARDGGEAVIRVDDNGLGIAAEVLPTVWDLFTQARDTLDKADGGLGIGLSLVRRLVELHGGRVEAASLGRGYGSTFTVRFPLGMATPLLKTNAAPLTTQHRTSTYRILAIDDNPDAVWTLAMMLDLSGHQAKTAKNGCEGLALAREIQPDIIFVDIGLPDIDGYEVARRMRQQPETCRAVLVALTGWGTEEDLRKSKDAGFDAHLTKPVSMQTIDEVFSRFFASKSRLDAV